MLSRALRFIAGEFARFALNAEGADAPDPKSRNAAISHTIDRPTNQPDQFIYLRLSSAGTRDLLDKLWTVDEFAAKFFDLSIPEQSVFRALNAVEEAENIAAHFLGLYGNATVKQCAAIRIYPADLSDLGISISAIGEREGATGINCVDARHHDLVTDPDSLVRLSERILTDRDSGGDRFRVLGEHQLAVQVAKARASQHNLKPKSLELCERVMASHCKKNPDWKPQIAIELPGITRPSA